MAYVETLQPEWLHHTAHVLLVIAFFPIYWHSRGYTHSHRKFGNSLAFINLFGSIYSIALEIYIQLSPVGCVFFCTYSYNVWSLYISEFRHTKILYFQILNYCITRQNGTSFIIDQYCFTKATNGSTRISSEFSMCMISSSRPATTSKLHCRFNFAYLVLTVLVVINNIKYEIYGSHSYFVFCGITDDTSKLRWAEIFSSVIVVPQHLFTIVVGVSTICRYYFLSGYQSKDLRILLLVVASYISTVISIIVILANIYLFGLQYPQISIGAIFIDRILSLILSVMAFNRIRKRGSSATQNSNLSNKKKYKNHCSSKDAKNRESSYGVGSMSEPASSKMFILPIKDLEPSV